MPLTRLSHNGASWPINDFVQACLDGACSFPAPIAATIINNIEAYDNKGTISGSQLHAECDYKRLLEINLDYSQEITDLWPASFRGANVHGLIETCRKDPRFKGWLFEKRFFAVLTPEDEIYPLKSPEAKDESDWIIFEEICGKLKEDGCIILSGALDAYDTENRLGHDWKTKSKVGSYTVVSDSWQQQMSLYAFLARLHGYRVDGFKVSAMDATGVVVLSVELPLQEVWVQNYLIPRARVLARHQEYSPDLVAAINTGEVKPPLDYPEPKKNYLCDGENRTGKVYCVFRENGCPAWRK